jgi:hypothetical protein
MFINVFTIALHRSLSQARSIEYPCKINFIIILPLRVSLPSGLHHFVYHTETPYAFILFPMRVTCSAYLIFLGLIILIILGKEYKLWRCSLCRFLKSLITCSLLVQHYVLKHSQSINRTPWFLVRQRTIPIERSPPASEASANFSG